MDAAATREESGKWDALGIFLSILCGIHCLSVPLLLGALPLIGLGVVADHSFEWVMMAVIFSVAGVGFWSGYRHHRRKVLFLLLAAGVAVFALLRPSLPESWHPAATLSGGSIFILGHWLNWRWRRGRGCRV